MKITFTNNKYLNYEIGFGTWLLIGFLLSIILGSEVNLGDCEFDACRFLKVDLDILEIVNNDYWINPTLLMHIIYNSDGSTIPGFVRAFLINAGLTAVSIPLIGWRNNIFRSPLAFSLFILPGKEFFLILGIGFLARAQQLVKLRSFIFGSFILLLGVLFTFLVRPGFILLECFAFYFWYLWINKKKAQFLFSTFLVYVLAIFFALYLDATLPGDGGFEIQSTIEMMGKLREYTVGIYWIPSVSRVLIYILYLVALPFVEIYRLINEFITIGFKPYHIFLIASLIEWIRWVTFPTQRYKALGFSIIAALLVGISFSFIHTRYLLPLLVFMFTLDSLDVQSNK